MSSAASSVLNVAVSGAAGQICYSLLPLLASGRVFGSGQAIHLRMLDIEPAKQAMEGVAMELRDCAFPTLRGIVCSTDPEEAFADAHYVVLVGGFPRRKGMLRSDLLAKNSPIFVGQGAALNKVADRNVKVLVVANPANTNCLVAATNAPDIPKKNFCALTRLDYDRARNQIAEKAGATVASVQNVAIWGNHSKTMFPDVANATVDGKPATEAINDDAWIKEEFVPAVQQRGAAIIAARGLSSAMSAANATANCLHDWHHGTPEGQHVAMSVYSDGNSYGIADGLIFSFPVTVKDGDWTIVDGLALDDFATEKIKATEAELLQEKSEAFSS